MSKLHVDLYDSNNNQESISIENPGWEKVKEYILKIDGVSVTNILLSFKEEENYLIVAGCWDNGYLLNYTNNNFDFYSSVNPENEPKEIEVFLGGQDSILNCKNLIDKDLALKASKFYFDTQLMYPNMTWESDY